MKRVVMIALLAARIATAEEPQSTIPPDESIGTKGYVGIDVWVGPEQDFRLIVAVSPNSPAERVGIIAGDYIIAIDQYATGPMSLEEFCRHASAPAGTYTHLTLKRAQTGATETVQLERIAPATLGFVFGGPEHDFRMIARVLPNGPAAKAGIIAGDYILAIDQDATAEMSREEFFRHFRAPPGTFTQLTLKRAQTGATETVPLQPVDAASLGISP
jgi:C-terminal processing protease CtpA/Prc